MKHCNFFLASNRLFFSLFILLYNSANPRPSSTVVVVANLATEVHGALFVSLQDLNDSPPVFSRQRYFTSVSADLKVGSSILKVEATDGDKVC